MPHSVVLPSIFGLWAHQGTAIRSLSHRYSLAHSLWQWDLTEIHTRGFHRQRGEKKGSADVLSEQRRKGTV